MFHTLAKDERAVEKCRIALASHPEFGPISLFDHISFEGMITANSLARFLEESESTVNCDDLAKIVKVYSNGNSVILNYLNFTKLTLPNTNP